MNWRFILIVLLPALLRVGTARADAVGDLLGEFAAAGAGPFDATAGARLWRQEYPASVGGPRACTSCHTTDLGQPGRHLATGKPIEPLAPSANPRRLADRREIEKWLARNCKWTLGRECSPQEKGGLLSFIKIQ